MKKMKKIGSQASSESSEPQQNGGESVDKLSATDEPAVELPNMTAAENGSSYVTSDEAYQKTFETYDAVYAHDSRSSEGSVGYSDAVTGKGAGRNNTEEFAAELAAPAGNSGNRVDTGNRDASGDRNGSAASTGQAQESTLGQTVGWVALALALSSLFLWPAFLGSVAVVTGFYAWTKGRKTLGGWAMGIGLVSVISSLILSPLY